MKAVSLGGFVLASLVSCFGWSHHYLGPAPLWTHGAFAETGSGGTAADAPGLCRQQFRLTHHSSARWPESDFQRSISTCAPPYVFGQCDDVARHALGARLVFLPAFALLLPLSTCCACSTRKTFFLETCRAIPNTATRRTTDWFHCCGETR